MKKVYSQNVLTDFLNSEEIKLQEEMITTNVNGAPSEWTIRTILGFSASLKVEHSKTLGKFEHYQN
jgi:hypothetical protein